MSFKQNTLLSAVTVTGASAWLDVRGFDHVAFTLIDTGSPNGTVDVEGSVMPDKSAPFNVFVYPNGVADPAAEVGEFSTPGYYTLHPGHCLWWVRVNVTVATSGAFTVITTRRSIHPVLSAS